MLACASAAERTDFLDDLSLEELRALPYLFDFWAHPHQLPPGGDWRSWVILGGRGAGKTRAGSEWVRAHVEGARPLDPGRARRVALVGETYDQAREVMIYGESGILACSPPDRRPEWISTRRLLLWPNGAEARVYSANDFEALRGPQFDLAWADEIAKWPKAEQAWDMLQFCMRLGTDPKVCVTTTPRNTPFLHALMSRGSTVATHAPTQANRAYLADGFLAEIEERYAGSRQGREEIEGELLADTEGALWTRAMLDAALVRAAPECDRIVVAVDPSASTGERSDECGIVVVGVTYAEKVEDWRAYVLEDASLNASPAGWAEAAVKAARRHGADRIVAEVNQGGAMVEAMIRQVDQTIGVTKVHATKAKGVRAEPVAALYEQGRVRHVPGLGPLEDQMALMTVTGFQGKGSPDRVDALVWAMTEVILKPALARSNPRLRLV